MGPHRRAIAYASAMSASQGFAPVAQPDARVLILGTLPGQVSLRMQQYYAQPRNVFWRIMGELADAHPELPYPERLQRLTARGIALWDVCAAAARPGSLDASINSDTVITNPLEQFYRDHPDIGLVCFNGATAETLYRRYVLPKLSNPFGITYRGLPSTSPAHAAMPFAEKLAKWSVVVAA
jgi:TDG/mug DNA glycosylase family protein